jgi:hypothetical protein
MIISPSGFRFCLLKVDFGNYEPNLSKIRKKFPARVYFGKRLLHGGAKRRNPNF